MKCILVFLLFLRIIQPFILRHPTYMIHNTGTGSGSPPELWTFLSDHLKTSTREWFICRAELAGIPW